MKLPHLFSAAALLASAPLASASSNAPVGELSIETVLARTGSRPVLHWDIKFPARSVEEVVSIENNDSLVTKEEVRVDVRLLGASYSLNGYTPSLVNFQLKVGSQSWNNVFTGTENDIVPSEVLYSQNVSAGTTLNFAGSGHLGGSSWTASRNTLSQNLNVIALKDGDSVPSYTPAFRQGTISDHVSAYIQDGKISIGPRDVIYLIELYSSNPGSRYFDMQDLVVMATFDENVASHSSSTGTTTTTTTTTETAADGTSTTTNERRRRRRRR